MTTSVVVDFYHQPKFPEVGKGEFQQTGQRQVRSRVGATTW